MKETISAEGATLSSALIEAASKLGVEPNMISYTFDHDHFKNHNGRSCGMDTVKINATALDPASFEGAKAAKEWLQTLTEKMDVETNVSFPMLGDKSAEMILDSKQGGRLVGRRGTSLNAIIDLFTANMNKEYSDWTFRLEVSGGEKKERRDSDRREYSDGDRSRNRRDRDSRQRKGKLNSKAVSELEKLAVRLSTKVIKSEEPLVIRQNLNSFERRVVHLKVQEIDGVNTESFMDDDVKKIRIIPVSE